MKKSITYILLFSFLYQSCTDDIEPIPFTDTAIVVGYMYAGEQVKDIKVSSLIPFNADSTDEFYINDAEIDIIDNGISYRLTLSEGDSGYYHYSGEDLQIIAGENYEFQMIYKDQVITAQTMVPQVPEGLAISANEMLIQPIYEFFDMRNRYIEDLDITWKNDKGDYYYLLIELLHYINKINCIDKI